MTTDQDELKKLRSSLLRIAQALDMAPENMPRIIRPKSWGWDDLVAVLDRPRGWNALAADIVARIEDQKLGRQQVTNEMLEAFEQWRLKL